MTDIRFYHLTHKTLEQALPELLAKTAQRGWRAVVIASSPERAEDLTQLLWTSGPSGFLPHGNAKDGQASEQPIWLTDKDENPNGATVLFLVDGASSAHVDAFDVACEIFNGHDEATVNAARGRWKTYKDAGHKLSYWKQTENGWTNEA